MGNLLSKLQRIDPRVLYVTLALCVALPEFVPLRLPPKVSPETLGVYRAIDEAPTDKIVIVESDWDAFSISENLGQSEAMVEHMMRRGLKFAIISANPYGPDFAERVNRKIAAKYGKKYGVDWCNWGYKIFPGTEMYVLPSLARDIYRTIEKDYTGTPLSEIPMMKDVHDIGDVGLVISVGYGAQFSWMPFVQSVYGTKLAVAVAAIASTANYTYISTGQFEGMLVGARGGAEYEALINRKNGWGEKVIQSQSAAHVFVILLIIIGNIGYAFASPESKRARLQLEEE
jgi:hypothetical protein